MSLIGNTFAVISHVVVLLRFCALGLEVEFCG